MSFLAPAALGLLGLLPVILILYFLKLKRKEQEISSTYLWRKTIQDLRVNSPFQKLRKNLLLWLQLLLLALLVFALARPAMNAGVSAGQRYICLVDTSASMAARDMPPSRIERAQREALRLISDMAAEDQMMLMTFDVQPAVVVPFTNVKGRLRDAVRGLRARETSTDFRQAVDLVRALSQDVPNVHLFLLSDGAFDARGIEAPPIEFTCVNCGGAAAHNVGITAVEARRDIEDWTQQQIFARVENFGPDAADVRVELSMNGRLCDARTLTVAPHTSGAAVFANPNLSEGIAHLTLSPEDDLAADNQAWLVIKKATPVKTLVVTPGSYFLQLALQKDPLCAPVFMAPDEFETALGIGKVALSDYGLVIFDRHTPKSLPQGAYLFLDALPPLDKFSQSGEAKEPSVLDWDATHPVNQYVNYANLFLESAMQIKGPPDAQTLVDGDSGPLVLWWASASHRIVIVGFDVNASRWPLRTGFPIFLANCVRHLGGVGFSSEQASVRPGAVISVAAPSEAQQIEVTLPDGSKTTAPVRDGRATFGETYTCGPYVFEASGKYLDTYVVNLCDSAESDITARESVPWGSQRVVAVTKALKENREIWPWLALGGLALLVAEWYVYNRRVYL